MHCPDQRFKCTVIAPPVLLIPPVSPHRIPACQDRLCTALTNASSALLLHRKCCSSLQSVPTGYLHHQTAFALP